MVVSDMEVASSLDCAAPDLDESIKQELRSLHALSQIFKAGADGQGSDAAHQPRCGDDGTCKGDSKQTCHSQCNTVGSKQEDNEEPTWPSSSEAGKAPHRRFRPKQQEQGPHAANQGSPIGSQRNPSKGCQESCSPATAQPGRSPLSSLFRAASVSSLLKPPRQIRPRAPGAGLSLTSTFLGTQKSVLSKGKSTMSSKSLFGSEVVEESTYSLLLALEEAIYQSVMSQGASNVCSQSAFPSPEDFTYTQKVQRSDLHMQK